MNRDSQKDDAKRGARFINRLLPVLALALSFLLIALAVRLNYINTNLANADYERSTQFTQTANDLRYYDEVLTLSATLAVVDPTHDWQQRYEQTVPLLDKAIAAAANPGTETPLATLEKINDELEAMEGAVFTAINHGDTARAVSILKSHEYLTLKDRYAESIAVLTRILHEQSRLTIADIDKREERARTLRKAGLGLVVAVWISVAFNTRKLNRMLHSSNSKLAKLAHFDQLTGIANRTLFRDRLRQSLAVSRRESTQTALLLIDLDNFKSVNDNLGHPMGDKLLELVAHRLSDACRESDTVARLGGDEFAIIATGIKNIKQSSALADKLVTALQRPVKIEGNSIHAQASIGIASFPFDADEPDELFRKADLALYKAKGLGKNTFAYFDNDIESQAKARQQLEQEIDYAIQHNQFELFYQPIVRLSDNTVTGAEALLRWKHPQHGYIAPDTFIPVAEENRAIIPIGRWVYRQACRQHRLWCEKGMPPLNIAVNLSGAQFEDAQLCEDVIATLKNENMKPEHLRLEVTESILMSAQTSASQAINPIDAMERLSREGISIAIDDFGTGYSSLAYLKKLPVNMVKIDRAFIDGLPDDQEDVAITNAILNMSEALHLAVVAEGIETQAQMDYLHAQQCDYAQGYYLAKPMPADQFEVFLLSTLKLAEISPHASASDNNLPLSQQSS